MLFNSLHFFLFFPLVTAGYFALPDRYRWCFLLAASCYFYMAFIPIYILILFFTILIDYVAGIAIENASPGRRRPFLIMSLAANIGVLAVFKYSNFVITNLNFLMEPAGGGTAPFSLLKIILPIGLSFHTFQSMSYTIEVYRGRQRAEHHLGIFAVYVMFYPQLVAGPIERPQNLLTQLREVHQFDYDRFTNGLKLMAWGLFKKMVVADRLAFFVNQVYDGAAHYQGPSLVIATVFFAFQIYCDFSGYSDIAIGAAQTMGFRLMDNFNRPYYSKSIGEFWKRWHISLSSWFRDYLYIPLGGNRVSRSRLYFNIMLTFLLSGLWHGANWTFLIWGGLNGFYLVMGESTRIFRQRCWAAFGLDRFPTFTKYVCIASTFALVCFSWIFFRSRDVRTAMTIISHLSTGWGSFFQTLFTRETIATRILLSQGKWEFLLALMGLALMEAVHSIQRHGHIRNMLTQKPVWIRWSAYYALLLAILFWGKFLTADFIYFQF